MRMLDSEVENTALTFSIEEDRVFIIGVHPLLYCEVDIRVPWRFMI